jgi:hypothetical protein
MQRFPNDFHNDAGKPCFTADNDIIEASLIDNSDAGGSLASLSTIHILGTPSQCL